MSESEKPAELLEGMVVNGWSVVRRLLRSPGSTGGCFSCGYVIQDTEGRRGYLKALDFFSALPESEDPARALEPLLRAFNHERDLLARCLRMSHIVTALFTGKLDVATGKGTAAVQYIAFEMADCDIRTQLAAVENLDVAWALRSLHNIAVALEQLHRAGISHQDTKPSNVLCFDREKRSKLCDLGRAVARGVSGPWDEMIISGDETYAPPELLYHDTPRCWEAHRFGCDAYHLGSMACFLFAMQCMTPLLLSCLGPEFHFNRWTGAYGDILPYLRNAFAEAVEIFENEVPLACRAHLSRIVRELCDPDPTLRGHPHERGSASKQYSLARYVTEFDLLARRAEYNLLAMT